MAQPAGSKRRPYQAERPVDPVVPVAKPETVQAVKPTPASGSATRVDLNSESPSSGENITGYPVFGPDKLARYMAEQEQNKFFEQQIEDSIKERPQVEKVGFDVDELIEEPEEETAAPQAPTETDEVKANDAQKSEVPAETPEPVARDDDRDAA